MPGNIEITINIEKEATVLKLLDEFAMQIRSGKDATKTVHDILFIVTSNNKQPNIKH